MKYETPELTALTPAITAIQSPSNKNETGELDHPAEINEEMSAYADWE